MNVTFSWVTGHELHVLNDKRKKSIDGALLVREKMFSLKRHFVTEHENVLSVRYVNQRI